jgi:pimeloyl-ACP methyl ester carboxylesterase
VEAEATTSSAVVLHPFGRSCLGYKSAAETDVYESIQAVLRLYPAVDPDRVVLAGFSMGGSGAYHIAAHRPDQWAAVHIGAAFAETYLYTSGGGASGGANDQSDKPWYEKQLWGLYDTPCYAGSLANLGGALVGYNGDADSTYPQQT